MISMEDFKPYVFLPGVVSTECYINGNVLGSTGLAWALIVLHGSAVSSEDIMRVVQAYQAAPGLYRRGTKPGPLQSADDYYGLVCGLALNGQHLVIRDILAYGKKHLWMFNSENPGKFTLSGWFGRFPALIAHIHFGCDERPNWFLRLWWRQSIAWANRQPAKNQDAYLFAWLMIQTYRDSACRDAACDLAVAEWVLKFYTKEFSMRAILTAYIGIPEHPLVKYMEEFQ